MRLAPTSHAPLISSARPDVLLEPPLRWARWWTSPLAKIEYGTASRAEVWQEAWIPADRGITGAMRPSVTWGGTSREQAVAAAALLAAVEVEVLVDVAGGRTRTMRVNPAIGVLHDPKAGAYWLAPLRTTVRANGEWAEAPHTIDGAAFSGRSPLLRKPAVSSASPDLVAVVGRDSVITPGEWADAPDDSRLGHGSLEAVAQPAAAGRAGASSAGVKSVSNAEATSS